MQSLRIVLPDLPPSKAYPNRRTHYYTLSTIRKKQQEEIREVFIKIQGAIEVLEQMNAEKNEKTD